MAKEHPVGKPGILSPGEEARREAKSRAAEAGRRAEETMQKVAEEWREKGPSGRLEEAWEALDKAALDYLTLSNRAVDEDDVKARERLPLAIAAIEDARNHAIGPWSSYLKEQGIEPGASAQEAFDAHVAAAYIKAAVERSDMPEPIKDVHKTRTRVFLRAVYDPKLSLKRRAEVRQSVVELYGLDSDPVRDFMDRNPHLIKGPPTKRDLQMIRFTTRPAQGVN